MGAVDLVIQVESPTSVARGLQRVGRAGHQVGAPSKGVIFPKYRGDLLECAVVTRRMHEGAIETTTIPRNPLDVLAQQLVAMTVMDRWTVDDLLAIVTRAAPYETLTREVLEGVLGMLAGAYPSDEFAELKPRVVWDRVTDTIEGRRDARVVAVTSGGTIPDRGLFGVFMAGEAGTPGRRVGELDEEMVYELRAGMHGDVIVLGASSWRVDEIGRDRVTVSRPRACRASCRSGRATRSAGRSSSAGRWARSSASSRRTSPGARRAGPPPTTRLRETHDLDERAAANLLAYLDDEREATGALPTDKRIVVERFRDELGDWRLCLLTPFGGRVHAPWSLALEARIGERLGMEVQTIWSDDGIAIRLPEGDAPLDGIEALLFPEPDEVEDLVVGHACDVGAVRQPLPRERGPGPAPAATPAGHADAALAAAPAVGRPARGRLALRLLPDPRRDVPRVPVGRLRPAGPARDPGRRRAPRDRDPWRRDGARLAVRGSLMFDYVAAYMYDGDTPIAERRAGALTLDRDLLRELLGQEELRELLDPEALADLELSLQALTDDRQATTLDGVHDLLRRLGDLSTAEVAARTEGGLAAAGPWLDDLAAARRAVRTRIAGDDRWIAIEDVARYRDGVGISPPVGVPAAFLGPGRRRARRPAGPLGPDPRPVPDTRARPTLGPADRRRRGCPRAAARRRLDAARRVPPGRRRARVVRPGGPAPPPPAVAGPAAPRGRAGRSGGARAVPARLAGRRPGRAQPAAAARHGRPGAACRGRRPAGRAADPGLGPGAGRAAGADPGLPAAPARRARRPRRGRLGGAGQPRPRRRPDRAGAARARGPATGRARPTTPSHRPNPGTSRSASTSQTRGASFYRDLFAAARGTSDREVLDALWDLVWAGEVTNDTFAPLRALRWKRTGSSARRSTARPGRLTALGPPEAAGRWSLVAPLVATPTERLHAQSLALLERHGVLTREAVASEGIDGGFAAVYPILRAMEDAGRIRRGYFVDGLGAAQFALAGALDRLRSSREPADPASGGAVHLLAAADPANPYGAALPWPRRGETDRRPLQRAAGAYVVLVDGIAALYLERGGATLQTLPAADDPEVGVAAARALAALVADGRTRELVIRKVDGADVAGSPFRERLLAAGFVAGYRGLALRAARTGT